MSHGRCGDNRYLGEELRMLTMMHTKKRKKGKKSKCRNVCALRIPILGICVFKKRKCRSKKRR